MNFYLLTDPQAPIQYAMPSAVGSWSTNKGSCTNCGNNDQYRTEPLQIEWEPGSSKIGDFSWSSYTCIVIERVKNFLVKHSYECDFGRVEIVPPTSFLRSKRPRVPYPYTGPHLYWLIPNCCVPLNEIKSSVFVEMNCTVCGIKKYNFKRENLYIDKDQWKGEKIFTIDQFGKSAATFIIESALNHWEKEGFTNLCPKLAGRIELSAK